ncbi:MAG: TatD family hydrolase [Planctomycetaceae bacterium]|nr:TatD family hydrolase [Planctomycetaceae bacterium]
MTKDSSPSGDVPSARPSAASLFDTHAHLDQSEFDADRDAVIARARAAGVTRILCPAVSAETSRAVVQLAERCDLWAAIGIHPNSTADAAPHDWDHVVTLADHPRVVALGETGLDRYWDHAPLALQQEYLDRHLRLAQQRDLPVLLHCRDAASELVAMVREAVSRGPIRGVVHAFSGDAALAAELLSFGLHISFAGNVTYSNKKFDSLRSAAKTVPDDRLLVETDSPYLVPQLFRGKQRRNEPSNVVHTAAFLAELRDVPAEQIARQTTENALRLFQIRG